jgi:citrate lyase beta subunit
MANWDLSKYDGVLTKWEDRRAELLKNAARLQAQDLPLRFMRQQAHFTTPASNYDMVVKAVEGGSSATAKILNKFDIGLSELADTLGLDEAAIKTELDNPDTRSPLVMVDGEDAQALRDDVVERGRENAIRVFREADWGSTLRFYRPSGLNLDYSLKDILIVLTEAGRNLPPEKFPIEGIIWPKTEHPEELTFVNEMLETVESSLGLKKNQIKLQFLIESGWAVAQLPLLVRASINRLSGLIFGIADYSADIGLPGISNNHEVCDWVRNAIVNLAGAVHVPAIDNMTVNYPVADKTLSAADNKKMILARLKEVYDDARHADHLGMDGKWVGHPAQLFAVKLAFKQGLSPQDIQNEIAKIEAYTKAVDAEQGATIIEGVMSDRATDRHARWKLRKAVALGLLDTRRGVELGIISQTEANDLNR